MVDMSSPIIWKENELNWHLGYVIEGGEEVLRYNIYSKPGRILFVAHYIEEYDHETGQSKTKQVDWISPFKVNALEELKRACQNHYEQNGRENHMLP